MVITACPSGQQPSLFRIFTDSLPKIVSKSLSVFKNFLKMIRILHESPLNYTVNLLMHLHGNYFVSSLGLVFHWLTMPLLYHISIIPLTTAQFATLTRSLHLDQLWACPWLQDSRRQQLWTSSFTIVKSYYV